MPPPLVTAHSAPGTTVGLLLVLGLGIAAVLSVCLIASSFAREPPRRHGARPSGLASRVLRTEHGLGEDELGRYFFLPTVGDAWREVCAAPGADGVWTHPLVGDALTRISEMNPDHADPIEYGQFAAAYQSLRRARLARCTAAYARPASGVG